MNALLATLLATVVVSSAAPALPAIDQRALVVKDVNTLWTFPEIDSRSDWKQRAKDIRENVLVSCGLWPMPPKNPLNAKITGRVERDGYSVEKVLLETRPGFFLGGNLYRPLKGRGPFPAVLNPHGHGKFGRLHDDADYSNPARCIQFARNGVIAFSYDMVGYNDTMQLGEHRKFLLQPELQLWSISLMGLQTWNSIRALDFLESLPDVDKRRIACTGESGGGTQTFMLGAADERLAAQVPVCMVSHSMQGGCQCENSPGLRVRFSGMEIAAAPAPRPQFLVACTGDWTRATLQIEGPAIARMYELLGERKAFSYVMHPFKHNYNQTSRESVYAWFNGHLLRRPAAGFEQERPYEKVPNDVLRVFPDGAKPPGKDEVWLVGTMQQEVRDRLRLALPDSVVSWRKFRDVQEVAWRHHLQLDRRDEVIVQRGPEKNLGNVMATPIAFGRPGAGDRLPGVWFQPRANARSTAIVLVNPAGKSAYLTPQGSPGGLAAYLVNGGFPVLVFDSFLTGELENQSLSSKRDYFAKFFTTYNRTDMQERVQDVLTALNVAKREFGARRAVVCGEGRGGLVAMLAAPAADGVVADAVGIEMTNPEMLLARDVFFPGLMQMGGFDGVVAMAAPNPLLLHNIKTLFPTRITEASYRANLAESRRNLVINPVETEALSDWMRKTFPR